MQSKRHNILLAFNKVEAEWMEFERVLELCKRHFEKIADEIIEFNITEREVDYRGVRTLAKNI